MNSHKLGKAERFVQTSLREWAYCQALCQLSSAPSSIAALFAPLQLASATLRSKPSAAYESHPGVSNLLELDN